MFIPLVHVGKSTLQLFVVQRQIAILYCPELSGTIDTILVEV